jgi:hypothetical protein
LTITYLKKNCCWSTCAYQHTPSWYLFFGPFFVSCFFFRLCCVRACVHCDSKINYWSCIHRIILCEHQKFWAFLCQKNKIVGQLPTLNQRGMRCHFFFFSRNISIFDLWWSLVSYMYICMCVCVCVCVCICIYVYMCVYICIYMCV